MFQRSTPPLLTKPISVLARNQERLHHFGAYEVTFKLVQLVQPELESGIVRVSAQISEVLHPYKRFAEPGLHKAFTINQAQ